MKYEKRWAFNKQEIRKKSRRYNQIGNKKDQHLTNRKLDMLRKNIGFWANRRFDQRENDGYWTKKDGYWTNRKLDSEKKIMGMQCKKL